MKFNERLNTIEPALKHIDTSELRMLISILVGRLETITREGYQQTYRIAQPVKPLSEAGKAMLRCFDGEFGEPKS